MRMKVEPGAVVATIRSLVDDETLTSPELVREFTMTEVAERLGTTRGAVRNVFNTRAEAADGVRLRQMDEVFDRVDGALRGAGDARQGRAGGGEPSGRRPIEPDVRFRALCDHLIGNETYPFFLEAGHVFYEFERRVTEAFREVLEDGIARGAFGVPSVRGAAQLAFDVLRVLAIDARAVNDEIGSLAFPDHAKEFLPTYANHMDLLLRSWGYVAGREPRHDGTGKG